MLLEHYYHLRVCVQSVSEKQLLLNYMYGGELLDTNISW